MKRRNFLKAFAAACAVPAVAAKAIASPRGKSILDQYEGAAAAYSLRNLKSPAYTAATVDSNIACYDQSGNYSHARRVNNREDFMDGLEFIKPEDAPLRSSIPQKYRH